MIKKQEDSQQVKVQQESYQIHQISDGNRKTKLIQKKQQKPLNKRLQKHLERNDPLRKKRVQNQLYQIIDQGKTIQEAAEIMKKQISLKEAKQFVEKLQTQHEKCQQIMKIDHFNDFFKAGTTLFHLTKNGMVNREDVKDQMGIFLAGELVRLKMKKMKPDQLREKIGPAFLEHQLPVLEMPQYLEPPGQYLKTKKQKVKVKLQE